LVQRKGRREEGRGGTSKGDTNSKAVKKKAQQRWGRKKRSPWIFRDEGGDKDQQEEDTCR